MVGARHRGLRHGRNRVRDGLSCASGSDAARGRVPRCAHVGRRRQSSLPGRMAPHRQVRGAETHVGAAVAVPIVCGWIPMTYPGRSRVTSAPCAPTRWPDGARPTEQRAALSRARAGAGGWPSVAAPPPSIARRTCQAGRGRREGNAAIRRDQCVDRDLRTSTRTIASVPAARPPQPASARPPHAPRSSGRSAPDTRDPAEAWFGPPPCPVRRSPEHGCAPRLCEMGIFRSTLSRLQIRLGRRCHPPTVREVAGGGHADGRATEPSIA